MLTVYGTVIEVELDASIKKFKGGTYPGARLVYKNKDGEIKEKCFHEKALEFNADIDNCLRTLKPKDSFEMEMEKSGEFWNVLSLTKVDASKIPKDKDKVKTDTPKASYSSYVPDDKKQGLIIRQNVLGHAVKVLEHNNRDGGMIIPSDVVELAMYFERFVNTGELQLESSEVQPESEMLEIDKEEPIQKKSKKVKQPVIDYFAVQNDEDDCPF